MSKKTIALYSPYLATLGGGERHILSILQTLAEEGMDVVIFWKYDLSKEIQSKLKLNIPNLRFVSKDLSCMNSFEKLSVLWGIDYFFYVTDGSYFFSSAKHTHIFCMVPDKKLYQDCLLNDIKTWNVQWIANGQITATVLAKTGKKPHIITPYLPADFFAPINSQKQQTILSVGRFFPHLHSKRQDVAISWFKDLIAKNPRFASYKLILAGSLMEEDRDHFTTLQQMAGNNPQIEFHVNIPFSKLIQLYDQAEYYWHFAGYEVDEEKHPEQTEHLGITPMEAMARGCTTMAYRAGGPKEIIQDGETGYLFASQAELFGKMMEASEKRDHIIQNARDYISRHFSYPVFEKRVHDVLLNK